MRVRTVGCHVGLGIISNHSDNRSLRESSSSSFIEDSCQTTSTNLIAYKTINRTAVCLYSIIFAFCVIIEVICSNS